MDKYDANQEIKDIDVLTDKFLDNLLNNHLELFLDHDDSQYASRLFELLLKYGTHEKICNFLLKCIQLSVGISTLTLRSDNVAIAMLNKFVELCLIDVFNKYYEGNILGDLFVICSNAPTILRFMCKEMFKAFNEFNSDNSNAGYRAVCNLIVFRYYLSKIINMDNEKKTRDECKRINSLGNFNANDTENDASMMSLVKMLIADDIYKGIVFDIPTNISHEYSLDIINYIKNPAKYPVQYMQSTKLTHEIVELSCSIEKKILRLQVDTDQSASIQTAAFLETKPDDTINRPRRASLTNFLNKTRIKQRKGVNFTNDDINIVEESKTYVKTLFREDGLTMYDSIIDERNITINVFMKSTIDEITQWGITDKNHIKKITKLIKKCNKEEGSRIEKNGTRSERDSRLTQSQPNMY